MVRKLKNNKALSEKVIKNTKGVIMGCKIVEGRKIPLTRLTALKHIEDREGNYLVIAIHENGIQIIETKMDFEEWKIFVASKDFETKRYN